MIKREINLDHDRTRRIGFAEAVYSASKTVDQLAEILNQSAQREITLLLTRLSPAQFDALPQEYHAALDYDPVSQTAFFGQKEPANKWSRDCGDHRRHVGCSGCFGSGSHAPILWSRGFDHQRSRSCRNLATIRSAGVAETDESGHRCCRDGRRTAKRCRRFGERLRDCRADFDWLRRRRWRPDRIECCAGQLRTWSRRGEY